jgi:1D-myo-inositol-tetrakisphosphate 5-kinase/inositol-polyphosphate multikinase
VDARGEREAAFYAALGARAEPAPAAFAPRFFGVARAAEIGRAAELGAEQRLIALEDLTARARCPCVMDVKVGVRTYGETASAEKALAEGRKYPLQAEVGFRITGMRVWEGDTGARTREEQEDGGGRSNDCGAGRWRDHGRAFGLAILDRDKLPVGFEEFLRDAHRQRIRIELVAAFLTRLRAIEAWFEAQTEFRFYGTSLLFVYDGVAAVPSESAIDVRMIDFAHAADGRGERDEGFLLGLRTIIAVLESVAERHAPQPSRAPILVEAPSHAPPVKDSSARGEQLPLDVDESELEIVRPSGRRLKAILASRRNAAPPRYACVLLHGLLSHKDHSFAPLLSQRIAAECEAVCALRFDLRGAAVDDSEPGHRFSVCGFDDDADDAICAVRELETRGLSIVAVIGHSRGATSTIVLFSRHKASLARAVCIAIAPRFFVSQMRSKFSDEQIEAATSGEGFCWSTRPGDTPIFVSGDDLRRLDGIDMAAVVRAVPVETQMLFVHGTADATIPASDAEEFVMARGSAELFLVKGANHSFQRTAHRKVLIDRVIAKIQQT